MSGDCASLAAMLVAVALAMCEPRSAAAEGVSADRGAVAAAPAAVVATAPAGVVATAPAGVVATAPAGVIVRNPARPVPPPVPVTGASGGAVPADATAGASSDPADNDAEATVSQQAPADVAPAKDSIQTIGADDTKIELVDHGDTWSMHAENVNAIAILRGWHEAGGPDVATKFDLDYPFTLSVHHLTPELIVERILDGRGYTLHYSPGGRLVLVRVYSPRPMTGYKTPRLVESLAAWRETETPAAAASAPTANAEQKP